jgi:TIR domain-containing protein
MHWLPARSAKPLGRAIGSDRPLRTAYSSHTERSTQADQSGTELYYPSGGKTEMRRVRGLSFPSFPERNEYPERIFMDKENASLLFVSSARVDAEHATQLAADLAAQGFSFWTDQEESRPHRDGALQRAIRASSALLLVASPHARSARSVKAALSIAQLYQRPVYPVWISGETWTEALPPGWAGTPGIDARGEQ